jgi:L-asparaginase
MQLARNSCNKRVHIGIAAGLIVVANFSAPQAQAQTAAQLPTVIVLSTGGTIAGKGGSTTALSEYKSGSILGEELVNAVPEIKQYANVRVEQVINVGSPDITLDDWLRIANRINAIFAGDASVAGVVITHGTNTLEETAYFLNLTVKHDRPVVLVGAQRPATAISADGPLNLLSAIRTAGASVSRGKGVMIVMNDEINGARDVTKSNTYRAEAFRSGELGFLGYVDPDAVVFYRASTKRHTAQSEFDVSSIKQLPRVGIVYSYIEPDTSPVKALENSGVKGIVFAGTGAGGVSKFEKEAVNAIQTSASTEEPILVRSNRTGNGRVIARTDYDKIGMIPADNLNPQKARILLMLALTRTSDPNEIRRMFTEY